MQNHKDWVRDSLNILSFLPFSLLLSTLQINKQMK